ncbi:FG-GAP repeat domain-containing protein [Streptomyces sp. NPDC002889]|uniref:FG-GAP repeat domain-containing protein n=1 Tax=Streptomyces sp. NPDC002889 TaxID=3364669 RepID=UPI0036BB132D
MRTRIALAATALLTLTSVTAALPGPATAVAAGAVEGQELVLASPRTDIPRPTQLLAGGRTGFLQRQDDGTKTLLWTRYSDGTSTPVPHDSLGPCADIEKPCPAGWFGQGGDLIAQPNSADPDVISLSDAQGTFSSTVSTWGGAYLGTFGETVVIDDGAKLRLTDFPEGQSRIRQVALPEGVIFDGGMMTAGDTAGAALGYRTADGDHRIAWVDFAAGTFTDVYTDLADDLVPLLDDERIGWYAQGGVLSYKSRTAPDAEPTTVTYPSLGDADDARAVFAHDRLLVTSTRFAESDAVSLSLTGDEQTQLTGTWSGVTVQLPDGDALLTGGSGATDWWVQRAGASRTKVAQVPPYEYAKTGIALDRGLLRVAEKNATGDRTSTWTVTAASDGTLTASARATGQPTIARCAYPKTDCHTLWGNAVAGDTGLITTTGGNDRVTALDSDEIPIDFGTPSGGTLVDASARWVVYHSGGASPKQYVGEFGRGTPLLTRSVRAAALSGPLLWSADPAAPGTLTAYDLVSRKTTATISTGVSCLPEELQAAGRWVYWSCADGSSGTYDMKSKWHRRMPGGDLLLGDGFLVRHDHAAHTLSVEDAATGLGHVRVTDVPVSTDSTGAELRHDRRLRWTIDEATGLVAWIGALDKVHVVQAEVTPSAHTVYTSETENTQLNLKSPDVGSRTWRGNWLMSRPVGSWSLTFTSAQGKVVRTLTGGAARTSVDAAWDGRSSKKSLFPNGPYTWQLKAEGATVASGSGQVTGGSAVHHDYGAYADPEPDGRGDLLTLNSSGGLTYQLGTGQGTFSGKRSGSGWPSGTRPVAFGDLSGDRCNDVLIRTSGGTLRAYRPGCGAAATPSTPYTSLGTGWNQYDVLTSPGDVTGDGRPDLITRVTSTGAVYLHKATSDGKFAARVKLYADWRGYRKVIGAGDLNGDGIGDLLAQDKSNELWRYNGTGAGTFAGRVKVFDDWGSSYNAVVGVGDITGDGKADLVSRDTGGTLWRSAGNGSGSFASRVKVSTGWGGYTFLT